MGEVIKLKKKPEPSLLEQFEMNRDEHQDPIPPEMIAGGIFDCTMDMVNGYSKRSKEENQAIMTRIVMAGKDAIDKTINSRLIKATGK